MLFLILIYYVIVISFLIMLFWFGCCFPYSLGISLLYFVDIEGIVIIFVKGANEKSIRRV